MPILMTDIDSTLTDHWRRIRRCTEPRWPNGQISSRAWTWEEVSKDLLLPGAYDTLWSLTKQGYRIGYLTARSWDRAGDLSRKQLAVFNLPCHLGVHVVDTLNDKVQRLTSMQCDVYVDDFMTGQEYVVGSFHRDVAKRIEATGVCVIPFRNVWTDVLEQLDLLRGITR